MNEAINLIEDLYSALFNRSYLTTSEQELMARVEAFIDGYYNDMEK